VAVRSTKEHDARPTVKSAGAARRAVQAANQFLPPRLGGKMQVAGVIVVRLRAPGLDGMGKLFPVRAVLAGQRFEE